MADGRETSPTRRAELETSDYKRHEFPFPHFPPANPSTHNEPFSTSLKSRDTDHAQPKHHSRSHSRSPSSKSNLLLVATERLGQETHRANALDIRCGEILAHLRTIVEERDQLRRTLAKVQEELSLYKLQLDVAQNEIFRAQKIVDDVDKARVEAEEQAAKDRTLARQLASERAVWVAREEGRSEGFEEGLRQGRRWAYEAARRRSHSDEYTNDEEIDADARAAELSPRRSSSSSPRHWSSSSRSSRRTPPDAASYASTLPVHAKAPSSQYQYHQPLHFESASAPQQLARPQSTQEQPPRHQPTQHQTRTPSRLHSTLPCASTMHQMDPLNEPASQSDRPAQQQHPPRPRSSQQQQPPHPQPTQQQPRSAQEQPQPTPAQNPNRSPSAQSSRPLPLAPAHSPEPIDIRPDRREPRPPSPARSYRSVALPPDGIPTVGADSVISLPAPYELSRPVSIADTPVNERSGIDLGSGRRRTRTMSNVSAVSTRLSQFDILGPPRAVEAPVSLSDQVAHEWRVANADRPVSRQGTTEESHSSEKISTRSSAPRSQASRRTAPRRPREIVMPMPLSTAMHAGGSVSYTHPDANSSAALPPLWDPYSAPAGPSSGPPPPPHDSTSDTILTRPRSAMAWLKSRFNRMPSSSSIVNIQIEPPSNPASNPSTERTVNTILLTPEHAGTSTLPQHFIPELAGTLAGMQLENANGTGNVIVLPDNDLPRGFVPLSPILPNLHTVPGPGLDSNPPAPSPSPQPPAYTPHDIYAVRELPRPATTTPRARSPVDVQTGSSSTRVRGASIGSAILA
ncbi:hypothetical protein B0H12DRAFT_150478 [Mycena haematopus]|nr:hypothetical protein B0H12DRAFT_150478 [Mycena haematopus]